MCRADEAIRCVCTLKPTSAASHELGNKVLTSYTSTLASWACEKRDFELSVTRRSGFFKHANWDFPTFFFIDRVTHLNVEARFVTGDFMGKRQAMIISVIVIITTAVTIINPYTKDGYCSIWELFRQNQRYFYPSLSVENGASPHWSRGDINRIILKLPILFREDEANVDECYFHTLARPASALLSPRLLPVLI